MAACLLYSIQGQAASTAAMATELAMARSNLFVSQLITLPLLEHLQHACDYANGPVLAIGKEESY